MNAMQKTVLTIASLILMLVLLPVLELTSVKQFFIGQTNSDITLITIVVYTLHIVQIAVYVILSRVLKIETSVKVLIIAELGWVLIWFSFLLANGVTQYVFLHTYVILFTLNISPLVFTYTLCQIIAIWSVKTA